MTKPPVLVTGATGNVGKHVVQGLLDAGILVRAAASSKQTVHSLFGHAVEAVELDFTDESTWAQAYAGIASMFLMRPPHLGKPRTQRGVWALKEDYDAGL
jgi:uncharacterized protein YbjT (DUF2867 family)